MVQDWGCFGFCRLRPTGVCILNITYIDIPKVVTLALRLPCQNLNYAVLIHYNHTKPTVP